MLTRRLRLVFADLVFWHPAHVVMQIHQLRQLKARAEAGGEPAGEARSRPYALS